MKKGLLTSLFIALVVSFGLVSCAKEYQDRICETPSQVEYGFDSNVVNVRVINLTGYPLCNFTVLYRTDIDRPYNYGTLEKDDTTPFAKIEFVKSFPIVDFDLGTGHFTIADSLMDIKLPYESSKILQPGFYNMYVSMDGPLDSLRVIANVFPDPELMAP